MFKQIKNYELQQIGLELDEIKKRKQEIAEVERRISSLNQQISDEEKKQKVSLFQKIFHRRKYKETLMLTSQTISAKRKEKTELEQIITQVDDSDERFLLGNRLLKLKENYDKKIQAHSLEDLGYEPKEAFNLLIENNIPVVLEEDEKIEKDDIEASDGKIKEESDLVLVHKTNYMPQNDNIQTYKSAVQNEEKVVLGGEEYEITYPQGRDTVHFAVNHEVTDHAGGSWNDTKYAVIIPFSQVKKEQIGSASSVDTFLKGNVSLNSGTYILCPVGEGEIVKKQNPNVQVVEYEGERALGYANMLISNLGYTVKKASSVSWHDKQDEETFKKMMEDKGISTDLHVGTKEGLTEDADTFVYKFSAIMRTIRDNKLVEKIETEQIMSDLKEQGLFLLLTQGLQLDDDSEFRREFLLDTLKEFGIELSEESISQISEVDNEKSGWEKKLCRTLLQGIQSKEKSIEESDGQNDKGSSDERDEEIR